MHWQPYGAAELATFSWNALGHAFLDPTERRHLEEEAVRGFAALGVQRRDGRFKDDG